MESGSVEEFAQRREELQRLLRGFANRDIERFLALDGQVYRSGALPSRIKELLGLVASLVLRCEDCVMYHLARCREEGVSDDEMREAFAVALVVGGSVVIPHLRRAVAAWLASRREA